MATFEEIENLNKPIVDTTSTVKPDAGTVFKKPLNTDDALEEIQQERFYNTLKSYYSYREKDEKFNNMTHADLLDYFYEDRSWRNNNTVSMGLDMLDAGDNSTERNKEFSYIQQTYEALPSFWNDPNRSFGSWLVDNGGAMLADPINLIGAGVGGQAAKVAYRTALKEALKGKAANQIQANLIKEIGKETEKKALFGAIKRGALVEGYIGGGVAGVQDALLQTTALKTGVQEKRDFGQSAIATAAGFGFGTVFGGAFSYGGFKLTNRSLQKTSVKNLLDLHNYGRSEITGTRLFDDLITVKDEKVLYKNLNKAEIDNIKNNSKILGRNVDEQIVNSQKDFGIDFKLKKAQGKPPDEAFNYYKFPEKIAVVIKNIVEQEPEAFKANAVTEQQAIKMAETLGLDPDGILKWGRSKAKEDQFLFAEFLAHGNLIAKQADDILKFSNELHRVDLTPKEEKKILDILNKKNNLHFETLKSHKEISRNIARAQRFQQINKDPLRVSELIAAPEDPQMQLLKQGNPAEFYRALARLDDNDQITLALQNARKVNKWDLAAEFVNNNLLSSPDTHIINLASGLFQTQWKPFVLLLRAGMLSPSDSARAKEVAIEAFDTYIQQFAYTGHALKAALKSFKMGRGVLDSKQMKFDNNIRQGQLQNWINASGELLTQPFGDFGKYIQKAVIKPISYATTLPMRFLSAGDEFLKTMMYKGRMAAQIHTQIRKETNSNLFNPKLGKKEYELRFKEISNSYLTETTKGSNNLRAVPTAETDSNSIATVNKLNVNDPLQYAREGTYTQSAFSVNPLTGKSEGGFTGGVLAFTNKHKWTRALGLHFINTPANLLKWNFEQLPLIRKSLVHTRHALMKNADNSYVNPEAAAEANARTAAGMLLWTAGFGAAVTGKITGGGSRDYKENKEREAATGWQPYSIKTSTGYISLNRLDPVMMPFFIMADMVDNIGDYLKHNNELPADVEDSNTELAMGVVASLTRNIQSKFYLQNILETANFFFSDDFMRARAPERIGSSVLARGIYKITPLSGGLRYLSRIDEDVQKELFTFNDRLKQLNPLSNKEGIMPQRNMFGEKVDRKKGWLLGLEITSSPFAMTKFKNPNVTKFFQDREFDYRAPQKTDRYTKTDLRTIKNSSGQTAYDRMLEIKTEITMPYQGTNYNLKDLIEKIVGDKSSSLYKLPDGVVAGDDYRQKYILDIVHKFERLAFKRMWREFPELNESLKQKNFLIRREANRALNEFIRAVE